MTAKQRRKIYRIAVSAVLLLALRLISPDGILFYAAYLVPYLLAGYDVLRKAVRNLFRGELFDENFLMSIASVGAFAVGDTTEAVAVMLFYQVGSLFEEVAVGRSRRSIAALMDLRPDHANAEREGKLLRLSPEEVEIGEIIVVKAGERVPLDGIVVEGSAFADTAALTGESRPRAVKAGDEVLSGYICGGLLRVRTTKAFADSAVSRILALVEKASTKKARAENFITKFSRYYTPMVVAAAVILAVLPPLFDGQWREWLTRALTFLVISCPCALVISVPLSFFGGIGGASKCGILMKGGNDLEALAKVKTVVFDKTGTLTKGEFAVSSVLPEGITREELLELVAAAELYSDHPIALSIRKAYGKAVDPARVTEAKEQAGLGITASVDGHRIAAGNLGRMNAEGVFPAPIQEVGTVIYAARDGAYIGHIVISDGIKEDAAEAISGLRALGIEKTVMLTGDREKTARAVGEALGIDEVHSELLPEGKVRYMEGLLEEKRGGTVAFAGDGINDAPVLMRADVGIAMGALGSDAAMEAADIVLMDDAPSKLVTAVFMARRTLRIVRANIIFALSVKAAVLVLGALGYADMWAAVFADVGVSVIAILNAMSALNVGRFQK